MKKIFIFCFMFFLCFSVIYPENGTNIFEEQWKNVSEYDISKNEKTNRFEIRNKENKLYMEKYKPSEKLKEGDSHIIPDAMPLYYNTKVSAIATEVWPKERAQELKERKESLALIAYMSDKGEIKEVTFFLSEKASITPWEISLFERKLKDVKFELRNDNLAGSNYIIIPFHVNFKHLLEKYYE